MTKFKLGALISGIVLIVVLVAAFTGISWIGMGSIGIVKHMDGKVTEIPQGIHWTGWGVSVQEYPTYRQALGGKKGVQLQIGSSDQQELSVVANLNWNIDRTQTGTLYQSVGGNDIQYVSDTIVLPTMKNDINKITHTYGWNDIKGSKQAEVTQAIETVLKKDLAKSGIELVNFGFSYVGSPNGMAASQQTLAQSELNVKRAQADQDKAKIENATKLLTAQTDAQAALIKAQGEAKANEVLAKSLTPQLVEYTKIQKWDGKNPTTVLGNGTSSLVTVK